MASSEDLLAIGKQCSHQSCHLVDFLPFKCQHCQESYCQEHFMVQAHSCPKYDESKHNRVAPNCPFCNEPVAIPPGQDPNLRMETHIETQCSVMTGKAAKKSVPTCARGKCGKALYAPIRCTACRSQFCPAHRFPKDHNCSTTAAPSPVNRPSAPSSQPPKSKPPTVGKQLSQLNSKAASTSAAIKQSINSATTASVSASKTPGSNPFSKTDSLPSSRSVTIPKPVVRPVSSYAPPPVFSTA